MRHAINPGDPQPSLKTEWLLTNGLGGYAMGTALGANTRRYHGLLIAATKPPVGRIVALHSIIEKLTVGDEAIDLATHQFSDGLVLHTEGWRRLTELSIDPPHSAWWIYRIDRITFTKSITLHRGENRVSVRYELQGLTAPAVLSLRPLTPMRDFHELDHRRCTCNGADCHYNFTARTRCGSPTRSGGATSLMSSIAIGARTGSRTSGRRGISWLSLIRLTPYL